MIDLYSLEDPGKMWESEFLKREFKLNWIQISNEEIIINRKLIFIVSSNPSEWEALLRKSSDESIILILLSNENRELSYYNYLNKFDSVRHVFLCYPPLVKDLSLLQIIIQSIIEFPNMLFQKGFYFHLKNAFFKILEMRKMRLNYPWTYLPLGYSNRFVSELKLSGKLSSNHDSSIVEHFLNLENRNEIRKKEVFFHGRPNGWFRRKLLEKYKSSRGFNIYLTSKTGKPDDLNSTSNVIGMFENAFSFVPPGNISNLTFRYYESIICGSIPIHMGGYLQDWQKLPSYIDKVGFFKKMSHLRLYNHYCSLSHLELNSVRECYEIQLLKELGLVNRIILESALQC